MKKDPIRLLEEIRNVCDGRRHYDDCFAVLGEIRDRIDEALDEREKAEWGARSTDSLKSFFETEDA